MAGLAALAAAFITGMPMPGTAGAGAFAGMALMDFPTFPCPSGRYGQHGPERDVKIDIDV